MGMDRMAKELDGLKKAIKKATNKGGVKMALEMSDINEALGKFLDAVGEVFNAYEAVAQAEADEKEIARLNYDLYHRRLLGMMDEIRPLACTVPDRPCSRNQRYLTARNI